MPDLYDVLGVSQNATEDEIKRAYRQLARQLHPDANPGADTEDRFKEVTRAYEVLRDPERRRRYDMFGDDGGAGAAAGGQTFTDGFGIGDIFESFFGANPFGGGGARGPSGPPPGPDLETVLDLTFEEAVFGVEKEISARTPVMCATCNGSGARPGTTPVRCDTCGGAGHVQRVRQSILGQMVTSAPCGACGGLGEQIESPCPDCRGEGRRTEERSYTVSVMAGVDDGTTLRLRGRGGAGPRGGPSGDMYVHLRVRSHPRFERQGYDLVEVLPIPFTQATLGAHLPYDTLDGHEDLVVPAGTQTGKVFRLRGRGIPHVGGRGRGDLLVQVVITTPTDLGPEQEELVRRIAELRGDDVAPPETGFLSKIRSAFK
jgi:molecular chaperone DnaJ